MEDKKSTEFNRVLFLEEVMTQYINKTSYRSLKTIFDGLVKLCPISADIPAEQREINQEKRKILEQCFELFNDSLFKQKLAEIKEERNPQPQILARAIARVLSERILGDKKRKYDMSDRFSGGQIDSTLFIPEDGFEVSVIDSSGHTIIVKKIGAIKYSSFGVDNESIEKYKVTKILSNSVFSNFEVFSHIDLNELKENEEYRKAVLGELLSENNIELSNACGYIGEIKNTKRYPSQLRVGSQKENEEKFYRYQVSEDYSLIVDPTDLSAVVSHTRKQELEKSQDDEMVQ